MDELEKIALAIGHHFWDCDEDSEAIFMGMDCAKEVEKMLEER